MGLWKGIHLRKILEMHDLKCNSLWTWLWNSPKMWKFGTLSFELSVKQLKIVNMQRSWHTLFYPEISPTVLQIDAEVLFSAGNLYPLLLLLSKQAINDFIDRQNFNDYSKILGLHNCRLRVYSWLFNSLWLFILFRAQYYKDFRFLPSDQ